MSVSVDMVKSVGSGCGSRVKFAELNNVNHLVGCGKNRRRRVESGVYSKHTVL